MRPRGKIRVFTKCEIRVEMVPRGWPGNARFMLTPSRGEVRIVGGPKARARGGERTRECVGEVGCPETCGC